jgi:hypothetical protein
MAKSVQKKREIELEHNAWARFERAIDVGAKSPPQHRTKPKRKKKASPKPRGQVRNMKVGKRRTKAQ